MIVRILRVTLPAIVLGLGLWVAFYFYQSKPVLQPVEPEPVVPVVRVLEVTPTDLQWRVRSQGTVVPHTVGQIIPEVSGRVTWVSPALTAGGFFAEGDVLVRLDKRDFELAEVRADAELARTRFRLEQEKAEAEVARREWAELGKGDPSPLTLRQPQLAQAEAELAAAQAALESASRDLARTEIRAPFDGRVRSKNVAVGEFVNRGSPLAEVYAVDYAEVRLPLPDSELAYLDLPLDYRGRAEQRRGPEVILSADFGGSRHSWRGRVVRTEGEIDVSTRMLYAVARVDDPYGAERSRGRPPLAAGLFVEAELIGRWARAVIVLPRGALRDGDRVLVVSEDSTLHFREVEVVRREDEQVVIEAGLESGERVCVSPLETVVEGMRVRVHGVPEDGEAS